MLHLHSKEMSMICYAFNMSGDMHVTSYNKLSCTLESHFCQNYSDCFTAIGVTQKISDTTLQVNCIHDGDLQVPFPWLLNLVHQFINIPIHLGYRF